MKPVLFLDIDGVLNGGDWMEAGHMRGDDRDMFAPHLCALLDEVVVRSDCDVVLSSSWRIIHSLTEVQAHLRARGAPVCASRLIDITPRWRTAKWKSIVGAHDSRGAEIQAWLDANPRAVIAIVDDSDDMGTLGCRLVRTSWKTGIDAHSVERLVALLTEAP